MYSLAGEMKLIERELAAAKAELARFKESTWEHDEYNRKHAVARSIERDNDKDELTRLRALSDQLSDNLSAVGAAYNAEKARAEKAEAEVERLTTKIGNQADRLRYLEGATNHATGTPLSQAIARAERAEAEVERLKVLSSWAHTCVHHTDAERANAVCPCCAIARAEKAEADTARLDWLWDNADDIYSHDGRVLVWLKSQEIRAAIDAAMKGTP